MTDLFVITNGKVVRRNFFVSSKTASSVVVFLCLFLEFIVKSIQKKSVQCWIIEKRTRIDDCYYTQLFQNMVYCLCNYIVISLNHNRTESNSLWGKEREK